MNVNEMTPVEARTKLCPQFVAKPSDCSGDIFHCCADECADWLWDKTSGDPPTAGHCGRVDPK